ncbi:hypothetical protein AVDCRST_MAG94-2640 [uncultured Leptolyngbya sp.]|uniref:Uncharacterized protein n=1 Tax=uncultured Leptolyngbya sp. TaxID=332963 RepID=A0A6J4M2A6_9CYAN|nr:hypothetical protein AVDCRST_MAG94-2640 [uncultured Leptolyngbya sp.]
MFLLTRNMMMNRELVLPSHANGRDRDKGLLKLLEKRLILREPEYDAQ